MINPYQQSELSHKEQIGRMFDNIAHKYDFLNHFLSVGIDKKWRRKTIRLLKPVNPRVILDVATGTGDFAIDACKLDVEKIIGVDISGKMLSIGKEKIKDMGLNGRIILDHGDCENLKYPDNSFDAVTAGFGVRNFDDIPRGISEMYRVLKPGGHMMILELSRMDVFPVKQLFELYFHFIVPMIGKMISKDKAAYAYLPKSVKAFPKRKRMIEIIKDTGFEHVKVHKFTLGVATLFQGVKD
jgi:demethylmenaquinone methyltransferase/2-methoxy-6-polyprenyl-1,4-benzoquinol methylase